MRRTILFLAAVALVLALAPPAVATSGTMIITTDTTLAEDHAGSIVIDADDITLDCAGFTVSGPDLERGISVDGHSGVTVKDCVVTGFFHGIVVVGEGSSNSVRGNSTYSNTGSGIVIGATDTTVIGNHANDNADWGFQAGIVGGNTYRDNEASGNQGGFAWDHGSSDRVIGNLARGNDVFGFGIAHSSNMTLRGNTARGNGDVGFGLWPVDTSHITGNTSVGNGDNGFSVWRSDRNVLANNRALGNGAEGIWLGRSDENVVTSNTSRGNDLSGFLVFASDDNTFRSNESSRNHRAGGTEGAGFETSRSNGNRYVENHAVANQDGFIVWNRSSDNTFVRNAACRSEDWDAYDNHSGTGNVWRDNDFCNERL